MGSAEIFSDENNGVYYVTTNALDQKELLTELGTYLENKGLVKNTYVSAIIEREKTFPTGLPTVGVSIAMPHTDSIHVNKKSVLVASLVKPIPFQVMGSIDEFVDVEIVFMLGIKDPEDQLKMLQKLIEMCQNEPTLQMIKRSEDIQKIKNTLTQLVS